MRTRRVLARAFRGKFMQRPSVPGPVSQAQPKAERRARVVMIVDDHAHFRSALRNWMAGEDARYELIEAESAEEALALAGSREVHVVLMDIELPGMNGIDATRQIKEMFPEIAVIIVSQHAAQAYVERARAAGAFAYITKDRVYRELLPAVGRALGSAVDLDIHHG